MSTKSIKNYLEIQKRKKTKQKGELVMMQPSLKFLTLA